jgi:hypothetical protein
MKVEFQTPRSPKMIGRFCLIGAYESISRRRKREEIYDLEEVNVHLVCSGEKLIDNIHPVVKSKWKDTNSRTHGVSPTNPIPKSKDVVRVDTYRSENSGRQRGTSVPNAVALGTAELPGN